MAAAAATRSPSEAELEGLRLRLRDDFPFYAENCLKIVDKRAQLVPFRLNNSQLELWERLQAQRKAGRPMRAIILKSRKIGFSTMSQGMLIQRCTTRPYRRGLVVAQDRTTAGELWGIGDRMYKNLPVNLGYGLSVKPPISHRERNKFMSWGETSGARAALGDVGLDSSLLVDTAREAEAGRGFTFTDVHLSEVAFWDQGESRTTAGGGSRKMVSILNAVPDDLDTMVLLESTANSTNFFKSWWDRAERGESEYIPFFAAWWRDETCVRPFLNDDHKQQFISEIGTGPWGEEEPSLIELYGCTPEQLYWRRSAIRDKSQGRLDLFHQEYPSSPEEAFILSGEHRFSTIYIQRAVKTARDAPEPELGELRVKDMGTSKGRFGAVEVPKTVEWRPRQPGRAPNAQLWHLWLPPDPAKDYVVAMDPMGGEATDEGELAFHGIEVIDHRTGEQQAEWMGRGDADLAALEAFKAAVWYGNAWLAIETTGGYGTAAAKRFWEDFHYPYVWRRKNPAQYGEKRQKQPGWDTNRETKVILEEGFEEQLREQTHGIKSVRLALQLASYVRDLKTGKTGPAEGAFADLLMAYMIGQQIARMAPMKIRKKDRGTLPSAG